MVKAWPKKRKFKGKTFGFHNGWDNKKEAKEYIKKLPPEWSTRIVCSNNERKTPFIGYSSKCAIYKNKNRKK